MKLSKELFMFVRSFFLRAMVPLYILGFAFCFVILSNCDVPRNQELKTDANTEIGTSETKNESVPEVQISEPGQIREETGQVRDEPGSIREESGSTEGTSSTG
ncbi:MAG: hypothetical protein AAGJ35_01160, partial [Myxococcota bacterium]